MLEVPNWVLESRSWFGYSQWSLINPCTKFGLDILIFKVQTTSMSFESPFGAFEDALSSWLGFGMLILVWIWSLVFYTPMFKFCLSWFSWCKEHPSHFVSILILKVQKIPCFFKSWFRTLEDAVGSWLGFGILIIIHDGSLCSDKCVLKSTFA